MERSSRNSFLGQSGRAVNVILRRRGVELHRTAPAVVAPDAAFRERSKAIERRHRAQTLFHVDALRARYREPVFGRVRVWDLVERLAQCVDPTDCRLFCTNQQIHVLQILEGMERDGVADPDLALTALIHDLGKLLLLTDEDPANVVCMNTPIGDYADGVGLDVHVPVESRRVRVVPVQGPRPRARRLADPLPQPRPRPVFHARAAMLR